MTKLEKIICCTILVLIAAIAAPFVRLAQVYMDAYEPDVAPIAYTNNHRVVTVKAPIDVHVMDIPKVAPIVEPTIAPIVEPTIAPIVVPTIVYEMDMESVTEKRLLELYENCYNDVQKMHAPELARRREILSSLRHNEEIMIEYFLQMGKDRDLDLAKCSKRYIGSYAYLDTLPKN